MGPGKRWEQHRDDAGGSSVSRGFCPPGCPRSDPPRQHQGGRIARTMVEKESSPRRRMYMRDREGRWTGSTSSPLGKLRGSFPLLPKGPAQRWGCSRGGWPGRPGSSEDGTKEGRPGRPHAALGEGLGGQACSASRGRPVRTTDRGSARQVRASHLHYWGRSVGGRVESRPTDR
jgi:hypothetical protein